MRLEIFDFAKPNLRLRWSSVSETEGLSFLVTLGSYCNPSVSAYGGATSPYTGEALVRRRLERRRAKAFPSEGKVARRAG